MIKLFGRLSFFRNNSYNMDDKVKKLLQIVQELRFPLLPEESEENLKNLPEVEIDYLLKVYEHLKNYQKEMEDTSKSLDPKRYEELKEDYYNEMLNIKLEYNKKQESAQKEIDEKLDAAEAKAEKSMDEAFSKYELTLTEISDIVKNITSRLNGLLLKVSA